ncbi:sensor histidine kinase [Emcibacter nanhaiensis]|uniref:histidine kinase n=1 Tax=Emcibacter nanhaiensis TaxID=1505037 RepID=A0A501PL04_9PROT|nr:sensor histidine kinase [Emcibacter nanhaiensis]TPD60747.1 sensor histidine kinase [Emcibacter nanhaiensis]
MKSLRDRLTLNVLITSILFFVFMIAFNIYFFNRFGENFVKARLEHDMEALLTALEVNPETGDLTLDDRAVNPIFKQPYSGHYFRIDAGVQTFLSRSLWDYQMQPHHHELGTLDVHHIPGPQGQSLLLLEGSYRIEGKDVLISVTEDYSPISDNLTMLGLLITSLGAGIIIVLSFMQRWMVVRGLSPLTEARQELSNLEKGKAPLLKEEVPEEIKPLVQEINQLLVLADNRIKRSATAIGNLAHSLKTPLSLLEQMLSSADNSLDESRRKDMKKALEDIRFYLDSELRKARIIGTPTRGQKISVFQYVSPLVETLKKVYFTRGLKFDIHLQHYAVFTGDSHDLMELVGNLMDNACKWAEKTVRLHIRQPEDDVLVIEVSDDGPGGTPEVFSMLEKRGIRRDESGDGHGLGLSIVREIVDLYGAEIEFSRSPDLGGLRVRIIFS